MDKRIDFLNGSIGKTLLKLALPLMATSLIQMAYNMSDMIWIGRLGAGAVAAVGVAGMFTWLSNGLVTLARTGGQVRVGHSLGAGEVTKAAQYAQASLHLCISLSVIYSFILLAFAPQLIHFFKLSEGQVIADAEIYLRIVGAGMPLVFFTQIMTAFLTVSGNSKTPFRINAVGLIVNIILDPLFIFGFGPIPAMGAAGAGVATVTGQFLVAIQFLFAALQDKHLFCHVRFFSKPDLEKIGDIFQLSLPAALQNILFPLIAMVISRMVASFGDAAIAVQKVGSQIESVSWVIADGFSVAVNSFMAQNWGAKNLNRAKKGFFTALFFMSIWGIFTTGLLYFLAVPIFRVFIPDPSVTAMGVEYLQILSYSQMFMCWQIMIVGAFAGLGHTLTPSLVCSTFTAARIPMAMLLTTTTLGLCGIWWSISLSSIIQGVLCLLMFLLLLKKLSKQQGLS